ncbi:MAG: hypothetical protein B6D39_09125 [Anaerolineae bacterium UTCFX2]|nr:glycosyltransferase [Anaerolineales bacterium]OQY89819.1 MAG: hypothetical protein B6D39_09125 [Anaerolineae bacterium UTCFX2]
MNDSQTLRLGFHYHIPACQQNGGWYVPGYLGLFLDSLADRCQKLVCFLHNYIPTGPDRLDHRLDHPHLEVVPIGPHGGVPQRLLHAARHCRPLRQRRHELDAVLLRGPSPLLPAMGAAAGAVPLALLLVGDYQAGVGDAARPLWRRELDRLFSTWNKYGQDRLARRSLTLVNSRKLFRQYQPIAARLVETRTTTLSRADFYAREDTCQSPPYRLLYTGRIERAKGVLLLVEALALLVSRGEDLRLDLVGWPEKGDPILDELAALASARGVGERVTYHGYRPLGPELFQFYRQADLYVLASISNFEGFPRTIWEALAHSLPVVATRVGSIPDYLTGAAELVDPGDPPALAEGILRLLRNPDLRMGNIRNGVRLARQNTLDIRAVEIIQEIAAWVDANTSNGRLKLLPSLEETNQDSR